jgi:hypothetical protein
MKGLVWFGMALLLVVGPAGADVVDSPASGPPEGWVTGPDGQVTFTTQGQAVHLGTFTGRSTVTFEGRSYTTDDDRGSSTGHGYYAVPEVWQAWFERNARVAQLARATPLRLPTRCPPP